MEDTVNRRSAGTPVHVWIVGGLAAIWNGFACYDYLMTRLRNTDYLAQMMPTVDPETMLTWIDNFPIWAQFGWGLGVWCGLLGAVLLVLRNRWAVWGLGLSFVGAILGLGYQIIAAPLLPGAEDMMFEVIPYVIIAVAGALFVYARAMETKGVLR